MSNCVSKSNPLHVFFAIVALALVVSLPSALHAQTFQNIPALAFSKPFGGQDPLPQVLAVTSTGADFTFNVATSTNSGGNWLSASPTGVRCCNTPEAVTISVSNTISMAAGTYTGQVVFTNYPSGTVTLHVPITLTITATGAAAFNVEPGQLSFSMKTSGNAPPGQVMEVLNTVSGTLNWTLTVSTADGGNWLTTTATSGTAPSTLTVGVSLAGLPGHGTTAGTFTGQLLLRTSGDSVTIPVSMTVGNPAFVQANPLYFTMPFAGSNPLPKVLSVASTGTSFTFNAVAVTGNGGSWLQVSPAGVRCCNTPEAMTVSVVNVSSLAAGTYTGEVIFTQYPSNNLVMTVPITLTVEPSSVPFFDSVPGQLSFSMKTNGINPPGQVMQIRNAGSGSLPWTLTATTADGGTWLHASTVSGTAPSTLTISITTTDLPGSGSIAGTFDGNLLFQGAGDIVTVPITATIGDPVFVQGNPISFTMPFGGANPLPQVVNVASTGTSFTFNAFAVNTQGGSWLQVSPSGVRCCNTPEAMTVSVVNAGSLNAGTYSGEVIFTQYPSNNLVMTVPVTLTVEPSNVPFFDSMPGQLTYSMITSGNAPPAQLIQVRNAGSGTLNWTLTTTTADGGAWLTTTSTSGTAPSTLTVGISLAGLPGNGLLAGTWDGELLFESGTDTVTVPVSVTVGNPAFVQANPISFNIPFSGANPLPQIVNVASTGTSFTFNAVAVNAQGGNWLQVSPSGVRCCNTPEAMTVTVANASALAAGTYSGEVIFTQYPSNNLVMTVPVTLTIEPSNVPFFGSMPGQLTFSMNSGGLAPPAQVMQVLNGGSGILKWTLTTTTADRGAWLHATPALGSGPKAVKVSITPVNLPGQGKIAGTFDGELLFQSGQDTATVPVSVTVGPGFVQLNPLNFVMPFGGANPLPQVVPVATQGTNFTFNVQAFNANGGNWLQVSPSGVRCCNTPEFLGVSIVNASSLASGTYLGEVTFTEYPSNNLVMTVPVTLTVVPSGKALFDNMPGLTSFSFTPSSTNPPTQVVPIVNGGPGTLNWTSTITTGDGSKWLTITPTLGTAPSAVAVKVTNSKLPGKGLIAGTYVGQQAYKSLTGNVTVPVSVTIGSSVFVQLGTVTFTAKVGTNPAPQQITVASTGTAFTFNAFAVNAKGGNWLQISPQGVRCCNTPTTTTVSVNSSSLAVGTYIGEINFTEYPSNNLGMTVPVILTVTP
jgi:hypothetical protein